MMYGLFQALAIIDEVGDRLSLKYSSMPVPQFSEKDEDFIKRYDWWTNIYNDGRSFLRIFYVILDILEFHILLCHRAVYNHGLYGHLGDILEICLMLHTVHGIVLDRNNKLSLYFQNYFYILSCIGYLSDIICLQMMLIRCL